MTFREQLLAQIAAGLRLCVGLDPVLAKIPRSLGYNPDDEETKRHFKTERWQEPRACAGSYGAYLLYKALYDWGVGVIDATSSYAAAYKPNYGYWTRLGLPGQFALRDLIKYVEANYPTIPVVLDYKAGDIGPSSDCYADIGFDLYGADAVTVSPYLGYDGLAPFFPIGKGAFVLCHTTNAGARDLQELVLASGRRVYHDVADLVQLWANSNPDSMIGLVAGATFPEELQQIRLLTPDLPLLIPGVGKQGGDLEKAVIAANNGNGAPFLLNVSSNVMFASGGDDFAEAAGQAAESLHEQIIAAMA